MGFAGGHHIGGANRVPVHRGVIEARDIARRMNLLGENAAMSREQRYALNAENRDVIEDDLESLVGAGHGLSRKHTHSPRKKKGAARCHAL
jgi:hypothetical protein